MRAREDYLLNILSNNDVTFFIPPYQRNYEWDRDQCNVFLSDVIKTCNSNLSGKKSEHFFGTIVYVQDEAVFGEPNKLILTDGQQRITTTMLLLLAIRDSLDDESIQKRIDFRYLKNNNIQDDTEYKIKLKQVETDWEIYRDLIIGSTINNEQKNSAVYKNYEYFKYELRKLKNKDINILNLIESGLGKFSIVTIQLEPAKNEWENPQEIFESMNSLGKPLSLGDLVRNYLLMGKEADIQNKLYKDYWLSIEKNIPGKVSDFIRDYMQLEAKKDYKKATAGNYKELYVGFKELFATEETEGLMAQLKKYSAYYSFIINGADTGSAQINSKLDDIRTIGVTIANSVLMYLIDMWGMGKLKEKELADILEAMKIYFLRRRIIKITQGENKTFPPLVRYLDELLLVDNKKSKMFDILSGMENASRLPNDAEVISELKIMNFYNFGYAKFILSLVEEKITKSRPDNKDSRLQVEHIMPITLNDEWRRELGDDHERVHDEWVNNIGNLTLIRHNQELGNKSFAVKKEVYMDNSGLQIAKKEIIDAEKWTKDSIIKRNNWISKYIVDEVLAIPAERKNKSNYSMSGKRLSFYALDLIGEEINYITDKSITAKVIDDRKVLFEGKEWQLTPLTREIETRNGTVNKSGAYQGAQYWEYDGIKLADIM